jgi:hypothetical protein
MLRYFTVIVLSGLLGGTCCGMTHTESKKGQVRFNNLGTENVKIKLGAKVKLEAEFKYIDVGGISAVSVSGKVRNTTQQRMYYSYNVAFFDGENNLIGCYNYAISVEGGKVDGMGAFLPLPLGQIAKITSYAVVYYESDKKIGIDK